MSHDEASQADGVTALEEVDASAHIFDTDERDAALPADEADFARAAFAVTDAALPAGMDIAAIFLVLRS